MPAPSVADVVFDGLCNGTWDRHTRHLLIIKLWITDQHEAGERHRRKGEIEQRGLLDTMSLARKEIACESNNAIFLWVNRLGL